MSRDYDMEEVERKVKEQVEKERKHRDKIWSIAFIISIASFLRELIRLFTGK